MIEWIRPGVSAAEARVALFDFDGTISLIRSGWVDVLVPMMVEILVDLKTGQLPVAGVDIAAPARKPSTR